MLLPQQGTTEEVLVHIGLPRVGLQYVDTATALMPYTEYEYRVGVSNSFGQSYGPWAGVTTRSSSELTLLEIVPVVHFRDTLTMNHVKVI